MSPGSDLRDEVVASLEAEWDQIGSAGSFLTGEERLELVRRARDPGHQLSGGLGAVAEDAVDRIARDPALIDAAWVDGLEAAGLDRLRYVEILSVVSRAVAMDTFAVAAGLSLRPLLTATPGEPSGDVASDAKQRSGFVPAVGAVGPASAVSALPGEAAAWDRLHCVLYLSMDQMMDFAGGRELTRPQLEFVAARTSFHNDCFF